MKKMSFGQRLKMLRKELDLNQIEFCGQFNINREHKISPNSISQYEHDKRIPENARLLELADFFDVSVDYLLGISDNRNGYLRTYDPQFEEMMNSMEGVEEFKILFDKTKNLTPEQIKTIANIVGAMFDSK